ncbi:sugar transferase [Streptomyces sp. NBC_01565]|uniref:sugar transferase n=1 Tax=unclassified Streptomyces TaxID=2593676 RepID=UPI0022519203|nr:sugar transferase [Streptomyces sp. NBC_01565]MCX4545765.1 sugar transferase [Streptomyces sp. NBC_01565]
MRLFRQRQAPSEPATDIVARLMDMDDQLREVARLSDPDGARKATVLADIKRRAGGEPARVRQEARVPVGVGAPSEEEASDQRTLRNWRRVNSYTKRKQKTPRKPLWYLTLASSADVLGVIPAALQPNAQRHLLILILVVWALMRFLRGRYSLDVVGEPGDEWDVLRDWLLVAGILAIGATLTGFQVDPAMAIVAFGTWPLAGICCRKIINLLLTEKRREAQLVKRVMVVGDNPALGDVINQLASHTEHAYAVVAGVEIGDHIASLEDRNGRCEEDSSTWRSDVSSILEEAEELDVDLILLVPGSRLYGDRLLWLVRAAGDLGFDVTTASGLTGVEPPRMRLVTAGGLALLHIEPAGQSAGVRAAKGILDRATALSLILLLLPLLAVIALAVRLSSRGPVVYRQTRVGRLGKKFSMLKFRTAVTGSGDTTKVGRFLRRTSMDELPQLFNVLTGRMSLVGPRPPLVEEFMLYDDIEVRRLFVKPGMTGVWQIRGSGSASSKEALDLDLRYAENWSLSGDLGIIAQTLHVVAAKAIFLH